MIEQKFNKAVTMYDMIYKLEQDIKKCEHLEVKQILTKRMDDLQEEHDRLEELNAKETVLLTAADSLNKLKKDNGFTLLQRIDIISRQYPDVEIDLVFSNKEPNE